MLIKIFNGNLLGWVICAIAYPFLLAGPYIDPGKKASLGELVVVAILGGLLGIILLHILHGVKSFLLRKVFYPFKDMVDNLFNT